jgi:hypothetical protein
MGGSLWNPIATEIDQYERVGIGRKHFACVVKNPTKKMWHIFLESCGALIWTDTGKTKAIAKVKKDVLTGDPRLMKEQIAQGKMDCASAKTISNEDFFRLFKEKESR